MKKATKGNIPDTSVVNTAREESIYDICREKDVIRHVANCRHPWRRLITREVSVKKKTLVIIFLLIACIGFYIRALPPLDLVGPATPLDIKHFDLQTELPVVPESLEVYRPVNMHQDKGNFNQPLNYVESLQGEEPTIEKSLLIAKEFLAGKGIDISADDITSIETHITEYFDTSKNQRQKKVYEVSVIFDMRLNGFPLLDARTIVQVGKGKEIVGYRRIEYDLEKVGVYKIMSPQKAIELIPKYRHMLDGNASSTETGFITKVQLCYLGIGQKNVQPIYRIEGYTEKSTPDKTFNVIVPAIPTWARILRL